MPLWRYLGGERAASLPVPMMNVLNGGAHADNKRRLPGVHDRSLRRAASSTSACGWAPRSSTRSKPRCTTAASARRSATRVASRPTWTPTSRRSKCSSRAIRAAGYEPGKDVAIALDPASSEFYRDGAYELEHEGRTLSAAELTDYWADLVARYPIVSLEDGMDEEDWEGWQHADRAARRPHPARRRRHLRHQHRAPARGSSSASPTRS